MSSKRFYTATAGEDWPEFTVGPVQEVADDPEIQKEIENCYEVHNPSIGDIIAQHYGCEHRNYSEGGCDNVAIRQQIDCAIDQGATHVLSSWTDPRRILNMYEYPREYRTYIKYLTTEQREIDRDRYIIRDAIHTLEQAGVEHMFIPGSDVLRKLDWSWCTNPVYPNDAPQLWDIRLNRNHPDRPTVRYYYNHNTWDVNLKTARAVIAQLDW